MQRLRCSGIAQRTLTLPTQRIALNFRRRKFRVKCITPRRTRTRREVRHKETDDPADNAAEANSHQH
jgi:hypothetical protein